MHKHQNTSAIVPNLNELQQAPFLKRESHPLASFKDKQKYLPALRNLSYQCSSIMSKIFLFTLKQERKGKKIIRHLQFLTEKELITVEQLFQMLNENLNQNQFSQEVQKIKQMQARTYQLINERLSRLLLEYQDKNYLNFGVYWVRGEFWIKAAFRSFNYELKFDHEEGKGVQEVQGYRIGHFLVKQELMKKYTALQQMSYTMPLPTDLPALYSSFYDQAYFMYDEYILQLQVFHNHPLLRIKNYLPIKLLDHKTKQPLVGPIFSSSNQQCMYGHFIGYNANTIKEVEGELCEECQIVIEQLQQNELLMMLRDNVANPEGSDIFYCPEHNRFKLWRRVKKIVQIGEDEEINEEKEVIRTEIKYLNYYHFRVNIKKMTNKQRLGFNPTKTEQTFPLTYTHLTRTLLITDPARGKYCQHRTFTDLRLYYANYDPESNTYRCPVEGCQESMPDSDIQYLREVQVLMEYAKYRCEEWPDLLDCCRIIVENNEGKVYLSHKVREYGTITTKVEQIRDYYKTLVDPYITFPEYTLGMKEKERRQKMDEYMFGGQREEAMQIEEEYEEYIEEEDEQY